MAIDTGIEVVRRSTERKSPTPAKQPLIENPRLLLMNQRVRVQWLAMRLVPKAVTVVTIGKDNQPFSFEHPKYNAEAIPQCEIGTITKPLPDTMGSLDAKTLHFTPDPVPEVNHNGESYQRTQPPLVITIDDFPNFSITALQDHLA
jgi:hypothetical protein